jgi:hypothetical protein
LKDIRNVGSSESASKWLDPNAVAFAEIRNAMEHRSLKVVDDFGYELATLNNNYNHENKNKIREEMDSIPMKIKDHEMRRSLAYKESDSILVAYLNNEINKLNIRLTDLKLKLYEKDKMSSHSLLIPISQFESRLMQLIGLARNALIYLSLSIHHEERKRSRDGVFLPREVPLK